MRFSTSAVTAAAVLPLALAQTSTDCDPTKKSCPSDAGLPSSSYAADFTDGSSANASWSAAAYTTITYGSDGAAFSIANKDQAPTIETDFYFFFGRADVVMKPAPGVGIVSSIVLESDDLDEIDWEFVGGTANQVQSNFYGKGNTTTYDRAQYHDVADTQNTYHTYSVDWSSDQIQWLIDGSVVRTMPYSSSVTVNGQNFPQTPMRLKLGNWCGGCGTEEGTVQWAGGKTTFDDAPYVMYVKSVSITNTNPACSYEYSDQTGSFESINVIKSGDSCSAPGGSNTHASGSATAPAKSATAAPTSSKVVVAVSDNTGLVASTTIQGSSYSTNTASISAVNDSPASDATSTTPSDGMSSTSSPTPTTGAASANGAIAAGSLFSMVLALFML